MKDMTTDTNTTKISKKQSAKKPDAKSAKAKLAAGAAAIRKAEADAKKKPAKRVIDNTKPKAKRVKVDAIELPIPKIVESRESAEQLMALRVTMDHSKSALVLDPETTAGEYVKIFDSLVGYGEKFQLLIGDLILQGEKLKAFDGKYVQAMAATGRSIDSLKSYRSTALHTPKALRLLPYTHLREVVKVPALEDKSRIIKEAAAKAKDGNMPSVKDIRKEADKCKPRNKKSKTPAAAKKKDERPRRDLTVEEAEQLGEMDDAAARLESLIGGASFALEARSEETMSLREKLAAIARFSAQLAE